MKKYLGLIILAAILVAVFAPVFGMDSVELGVSTLGVAPFVFTLKSTFPEFLKHLGKSENEDADKMDEEEEDKLRADFNLGYQKAIDEAITAKANKSDIEAAKNELIKMVTESNEKSLSIQKEQGRVLKGLVDGMKKGVKAPTLGQKLRTFLEENKADVVAGLKGDKPFKFAIQNGEVVKSPINIGVVNTIEAGNTQVSITQDTDIIAPIRSRTLNYLQTGVSFGALSPDEPFAMWIDELDEQGAPIVHGELTATPKASVRYEERRMEAKSISVYGTITKNFERYLSKLVSYFERNLMKRVDILTEQQLLNGDGNVDGTGVNVVGALKYAVAFDGGQGVLGDEGLVGLIKDPNAADVLRAAVLQVQNSFGTASACIVKPSVLAQIETLKSDDDGHYLLPPFMANGTVVAGVRVIPNASMAGTDFDFLVGDMSVINCDFLVDEITLGFATGDFENRRKSILIDRQLTQFVSANDTQVLVKGTFATAKAIIEKT
jgi:hypothetical protein